MSAMTATHDMIAEQMDRSRELLREAACEAREGVRLRGLDPAEADNIVRDGADDYLSQHAARLSWEDPTDADLVAVVEWARGFLEQAVEAEMDERSEAW